MSLSKLYRLQSLKSTIYSEVKQKWWDIAIAVILIGAVGFAFYHGQKLYPLIADAQTMDIWFHCDAPRVFDDISKYSAPHDRTTVHPLLVLLVFPLVSVVKAMFFLTPITAVRIVMAATAGIWVSLLFVTLRLMGCRQFDAILFSILGAISAAAIFWMGVPDSYPFGGLTILLGLSFVALTEYVKLPPLWCVVVSVLTLSITVTNWMVGILATMVSFPRKKALLITLKAWVSVVLLVLVQKLIFPTTSMGFIKFHNTIQEEQKYINPIDFAGSLKVIQSFLLHTIVMPSVKLIKDSSIPDLLRISVQTSLPGSGSQWGSLTILLWAALLSLGIWGLFSIKTHLRLRVVLGLTLIGQLALHLIYGTDETFLYALHIAPLLLVLAALSTLTPARLLALVLAGMLVLSAGINNILQFNQAIELFQSRATVAQLQNSSSQVHKHHLE